jgi:hypothetical protein
MELTPVELERKLNKVMSKVMEEGLVQEKTDASRVKRLRVSSLPFCGVQWFLDLPTATSKTRSMEAGMKYYVTVGSAVHDVVQTLLAELNLESTGVAVIADWKCRRCLRTKKMQVKPLKCVSCGCLDFKFLEPTVDDGEILGHIDTILEITLTKKTKAFPEGKFWIVIDYKTSSLKKTAAGSRAKTDAQRKLAQAKMVSSNNRSQIRAYVTLLKKAGMPVAPFAALIYIPRDNPFAFKVHVLSVDYAKESRLIQRYKESHAIALKASTMDDLREMVADRPCSEKCLKQFEWCKWRHMCAGPDNEKAILRQLNEIRKVIIKRLPIKDWTPHEDPTRPDKKIVEPQALGKRLPEERI